VLAVDAQGCSPSGRTFLYNPLRRGLVKTDSGYLIGFSSVTAGNGVGLGTEAV